MTEYTISTDNTYYFEGTGRHTIARDTYGGLHVVYAKGTSYRSQIFYAKSIDNGVTWENTQLTNISDGDQLRPSIVVDSNNVIHVVWLFSEYMESETIYQICYMKYLSSWSDISYFTSDDWNNYFSNNNVDIAIDSFNNLHLVWDGEEYNVSEDKWYYYIRYKKFDTDWGDTQNIVSVASVHQTNPTIAIDSNDVLHIVWFNNGNFDTPSQLHYINYNSEWSSIEEITDTEDIFYFSGNTLLIVDKNNYLHFSFSGIHAGYYSNRSQVFYITRTTSWQSLQILTTSSSQNSTFYSMAVDENNYIYLFYLSKNHYYSTPRYVDYKIYISSWGNAQHLFQEQGEEDNIRLIWANFPVINGTNINRPKMKYVLIYNKTNSLVFYYPTDFEWNSILTLAIKTINGLPIANIKTINGLPRASMKTFNGLS